MLFKIFLPRAHVKSLKSYQLLSGIFLPKQIAEHFTLFGEFVDLGFKLLSAEVIYKNSLYDLPMALAVGLNLEGSDTKCHCGIVI
tara:strand:- start:185 stop:439 length:255 start_codon:yes stop_codon:yes gene_type:complete